MSSVAKPRNAKERATVDKRLREKYPQMYTDSWAARLKKNTQAELKKKKKPLQDVVEHREASRSALGDAVSEKELRKLRGG